MRILVNGEPREMTGLPTVEALLRELKLDRSPCAVEINRQLVPRSQHARHEIREGDQIELVTLVGGG